MTGDPDHTSEPAASPAAGGDAPGHQPVRFGRRLLVMTYEAMLVTGVLFGAALPVVMVLGDTPSPGDPAYLAYLLAVLFGYFGLSWTRSGQTLAMRAWKVRVEREDGRRLGWTESALRFLGGVLAFTAALVAARAATAAGLPAALAMAAALAAGSVGFVSAVFDPRGRAWPDLLSRTRLVRAPPRGGG